MTSSRCNQNCTKPQHFVLLLVFIIIDCFQLPGKLNELDNNGDLALDLALSRKLESIATTLVNNKADVDMVDQSGWSLLHKAIQRGEGLLSTLLCIACLFPAKMYQLCYCVKNVF